MQFIFLFGILALPCCFKTKRPVADADAVVDSLVAKYRADMPSNPSGVIKIFAEAQKSVRDSVDYYTLQYYTAICHYYNNRTDSAFEAVRKVIEYGKREKPSSRSDLLRCEAYNCIGVFWQVMDKRDSAIVCFQKTYGILSASEHRDGLPDVCINLADCYENNGDFARASFYYRRALFLADSLDAGDRLYFPILSATARLYQKLENYPEADRYFRQAEQYRDNASDYEEYVFTNSRGNYYYAVKDYPQALDWFRQADRIVKNFPQSNFQAIVEGNMGEVFLMAGQPDSARYYLNRAKELYGRSFDQPSFKFYIDGLYATLALHENNLAEAGRLLLQPYDTASVDPQYIYYRNRRLEEWYARKDDYENAYRYRVRADAYDDSLRNTTVRNRIAEIDSRYRQDTTLLKKDIRIAAVEGRASQWQRIALASLLVLALAGILILFQRRKRESEYRKQMTTVNELRMEIIRNRLSPHFMFNALNAVMPALGQYRELEQPFGLLIRMLRSNLRASEQIATSLENEIDLVKNYLQLQALGDPERIHAEWSVADDVPKDARIPSMCIQIPAENAVKYAFPPEAENARIDIRIDRRADAVHIVIEDNGVGCRPGANAFGERGTGSGLKMLHRTVELLNRKNVEKISFAIESNPDNPATQGTRVTVIVPLHYRFE